MDALLIGAIALWIAGGVIAWFRLGKLEKTRKERDAKLDEILRYLKREGQS